MLKSGVLKAGVLALSLTIGGAALSAAKADVIIDWNEKAVANVVTRNMGPPTAERVIAMVHLAMFDAVNSIERRYRPYAAQLPAAATTSKEAAAAAAAGTVLAALDPEKQAEISSALAVYLAALPAGEGKMQGIALGEAVAAQVLQSRANDGSAAPDAYRYATRPGQYVPTPPMFASQWPGVTPFAMTSGAQFRPEPPVALGGEVWAADYNEIKARGRADSKTRTARQTEDARFWLATGGNVYYPVARSLARSKNLNLLDNARLFALVSAARSDAMVAVFDAKYHYGFWRPITAIRNGDNDDNATTERDATWRPIADTPMHPEYPCAHCILAASMAGVLETVLGGAEQPAFATTSPTLPGVTHRWTSLRAFTDEVAEARISAGFHYRFSTRVGADMGRKIADHVVRSMLQPTARVGTR